MKTFIKIYKYKRAPPRGRQWMHEWGDIVVVVDRRVVNTVPNSTRQTVKAEVHTVNEKLASRSTEEILKSSSIKDDEQLKKYQQKIMYASESDDFTDDDEVTEASDTETSEEM